MRIDNRNENNVINSLINVKNTDTDEKIRAGRFIISWRISFSQMLLTLIAECIISIIAILTTNGEVYSYSLGVSLIYLIFTISTAKTKNVITYINNIKFVLNEGIDGTSSWFYKNIGKYIHLFLKLEAAFALDFVELDVACICRENICFATMDALLLITALNAALRTERVVDAIPLLVGFDFVKEFPHKIIKRLKIKDEDALKEFNTSREELYNYRSKLFWNLRIPIMIMFNVISIGNFIILMFN
jgi:hypothetical protein